VVGVKGKETSTEEKQHFEYAGDALGTNAYDREDKWEKVTQVGNPNNEETADDYAYAIKQTWDEKEVETYAYSDLVYTTTTDQGKLSESFFSEGGREGDKQRLTRDSKEEYAKVNTTKDARTFDSYSSMVDGYTQSTQTGEWNYPSLIKEYRYGLSSFRNTAGPAFQVPRETTKEIDSRTTTSSYESSHTLDSEGRAVGGSMTARSFTEVVEDLTRIDADIDFSDDTSSPGWPQTYRAKGFSESGKVTTMVVNESGSYSDNAQGGRDTSGSWNSASSVAEGFWREVDSYFKYYPGAGDWYSYESSNRDSDSLTKIQRETGRYEGDKISSTTTTSYIDQEKQNDRQVQAGRGQDNSEETGTHIKYFWTASASGGDDPATGLTATRTIWSTADPDNPLWNGTVPLPDGPPSLPDIDTYVVAVDAPLVGAEVAEEITVEQVIASLGPLGFIEVIDPTASLGELDSSLEDLERSMWSQATRAANDEVSAAGLRAKAELGLSPAEYALRNPNVVGVSPSWTQTLDEDAERLWKSGEYRQSFSAKLARTILNPNSEHSVHLEYADGSKRTIYGRTDSINLLPQGALAGKLSKKVLMGAPAKAVVKAPRTVSPANVTRTHGLSGRASSRTVNEIADSMRRNGFQGEPIKIFEHNGEKFILDGHHRIAAARRAGLDDIPFESIPESRLGEFGFGSADDVLRAAREAGGDRLRP
jgi:hypothetical protein